MGMLQGHHNILDWNWLQFCISLLIMGTYDSYFYIMKQMFLSCPADSTFTSLIALSYAFEGKLQKGLEQSLEFNLYLCYTQYSASDNKLIKIVNGKKMESS